MRRVIDHFENRLFELATAVMMLALATHIAVWPQSIGASAFRFILHILSPAWLGVGFFVVGVLRMAALIANGNWPFYGPILRAIGALAGAMIWAQMSAALFLLIPNVGSIPSPGMPVYVVLTIFELFSMHRALVLVNLDEVR